LIGRVWRGIHRRIDTLRLNRQARAHHRQLVERWRAVSPRIVTFVCYGNICRSPLAAVYAAGRVPSGVSVESAGFHEAVGRMSPPRITAVAARKGVDLAAHRSTRIDRALIDRSDLVLVMDHQNHRMLTEAFPESAAKVTYLGLFAAHDPLIPDPYSMSEADTVRVVDQICASVNAFLATLGRPALRVGDDELRVDDGPALPIVTR